MRDIHKKVKMFLRKYFNGTRGMISLFLALVMTPFLSCALILVESTRYQNAVQNIEMVMDSSAFSTLAGYDTFLEKRFGLLSVSQEEAISDVFAAYMKASESLTKQDYTASANTAEGLFALSDTTVLREQLVEVGETASVMEAVWNAADMADQLKKLKKNLKLDGLDKISKGVETYSTVANDAIKVVKDIDAAVGYYNSVYSSKLSTYKTAVPVLPNKAQDYLDAVETLADFESTNAGEDYTSPKIPNPDYTGEEGDEEQEEIDNPLYDEWTGLCDDVDNAETAFNTARDAMSGAASALAGAVSAMKAKLSTLKTDNDALWEDVKKAEDATNQLAADAGSSKDASSQTSEWLTRVIQCTNWLKELDDSYIPKNGEIDALNNQSAALALITVNNIESKEQIAAEFPLIEPKTVTAEFIGDLTKAHTNMDKKANLDDESKSFATDFLDFVGELFNCTVIYDTKYDAKVSPDSFYAYNANDVNLSNMVIMDSISGVVTSGQDFVDGLSGLDILKALAALAEFFLRLAEFLSGLALWVVDVFVNLIKGMTEIDQIGNNFVLTCYGAYNMPCRTTATKKNLYGFSYRTGLIDYNKAGMASGALAGIKNLADTEGSDKTFKGAETEYLLVGGANEELNQAAAFFNIYMFRLALDAAGLIFRDEWVKITSSAAGPAGWAVMLAILLAEPFVETFLLVNGDSDAYLMKEHCYCTAPGFVCLAQKIVTLTALSSRGKEIIKKRQQDNNGIAKIKSMPGWPELKMTYQENLWLVLLLTVSQSQLLFRMKNLVYMEAKYYYEKNGGKNFDLDKAYTYLKVNSKGKLKTLFTIEGFSDAGPFSFDKTRIIGY